MKVFCYVMFFGFLNLATAGSEPIKAGSGIEKAETELNTFGFREGVTNKLHIDRIREFVGFPETHADKWDALKIWRVDDGYLLITYTAASGIIDDLRFFWIAPRISADAADLNLRVSSFDPATGQMVVETAQSKPEEEVD